jgi:hypothetical protein
MCWLCDHPAATEADYRDHLARLIDEYGWAVQGVERDGPHPPWAYTVGLPRHGRPELVITGMDLNRATILLNSAATLTLEPGQQLTLPGGLAAEVVRVVSPWAHLNLSAAMFGEGVAALQLVHADERGRWPWERGYRGVRGGQPVLGVRQGRP